MDPGAIELDLLTVWSQDDPGADDRRLGLLAGGNQASDAFLGRIDVIVDKEHEIGVRFAQPDVGA